MMVYLAAAGVLFAVLFLSAFISLAVQPWSIFGLPRDVGTIPLGPLGDLSRVPDLSTQPLVSDASRYQLALAAGFSPAEGIIAVAISIAENGSGNPAALSGVNFDGSRDLGLWQVNSGWWPSLGGQAALIDPLNNARAAHHIYGRQSWCAWSTYESACGPGHTSSYRAYLNRAQAAARA